LDVLNFLTTSLLALSLLLCLALFVKPPKDKLNNKLLAIAVGILNFQLIHILIVNTGLIIEFPFFVRLLSPFLYLFAPLIYLYIKKAMEGVPNLLPGDYLHFLPAFIHFVDLIPFYVLPVEEKRLIAQAFYEDHSNVFLLGHGLVYQPIHVVIRSILGILYTSITFYSVLKWRTTHIQSINHSIMEYKWFVLLSGFSLMLVLSYSLPAFRIIFFLEPGQFAFTAFDFICSIFSLSAIFGINGFLFLEQQVVFKNNEAGLAKANANASSTHLVSKADDSSFSNASRAMEPELEQLFQSFHKEILKNQLFRNSNFAISNIMQLSKLKETEIRSALKHKGFSKVRDYLNKQRIEYVKKCIKNGELKSNTLEALALKAGFNSRITFYRAFQKFENITPKEFKATFE
jgi:AraC-like DNA-binding protein